MNQTTSTIAVERVGHAVVQDLGRPGHAGIGIPACGAADQHAARTANILVGNGDGAPLLEVTGSELAFVAHDDLLMAVTGAAEHLLVDGHAWPTWELVAVFRGARVIVPAATSGYRSYVAVNGEIDAERVLGSVAPDALLGVGRRLLAGDVVAFRTGLREHRSWDPHVFRLGATRPTLGSAAAVDATVGPDVDRMALGSACLDTPYEVSPQSDHIGLRLLGPEIEQTSRDEILSRGVPVGAIEVPPSGGIIMLLRGRLVTAGYPVVGVVTSDSLDRLGQVRPGDTVQVAFRDPATARRLLVDRDRSRTELAGRVGAALTARGLGGVVDAGHRSRPTSTF